MISAGEYILPRETLHGCRHRQAAPVTLSTGETVACVCVECYEALAADYIDRQVEAARLRATCPHEESYSVFSFGHAVPVRTICAVCAGDT